MSYVDRHFPGVAGVTVSAATVALLLAGLMLFGGRGGDAPAQALEPFYPEPTDYSVDQAGVLSEEQEKWLNDKLAELDGPRQQIAVVLVKTTAPVSVEEYGIRLAEKWRVGKKDVDNGAILIVATEDRKVRIEVGKGLEGDLTDAEAGRILDEAVVPRLADGDWYAGVMAGAEAISREVSE
jgi:uncharacterized protein